ARNAKPAAKTVRMFDRDGLYLEVSPRGGKWWRLKYRYAGKEKRVSPFGELGKGEFGTYFIGYSRTPQVTEQMLHNMFLGDPPGNTDRILDFSTAVTGGLFFSPTVDFLDDPPQLPSSPAAAPAILNASADGSLAIGSLKGTPQ
ncbi:MAG TPA: integrase arm-type DNA-binding domain-containing protein, partial [Mycobacterium sp.]